MKKSYWPDVFLLSFFLVFSHKLISNPNCNNLCEPNLEYEHWFAGPVFTPNPRALPHSHPAIEVVLITQNTYGFYNNEWRERAIPKIWSVGPYVDFQYSFNNTIGVEYIGSLTSNFSQGTSSTHLRDSILRLGLQVSRDRSDSWVPDFRILLQEIFPTGKYEKLDPKKKKTDLTGEGTFQTGIHFAIQKQFHVWGTHCMSIRGDIGYFVPAKVRVKGFNYYTVSFQSNGKVRPGNKLVAFLTWELSLSSKWNIACENFYLYQRSGHFSGSVKTVAGEKKPNINILSSAQFVLIPEVQHTITPKLGAILGGLLTVFGKNAPAYYGAFLSALYVF